MNTLGQVFAKKYYETRAVDDFERAGRHFIEAIEIAEEDGDNHHYGRYTCHLATLYESRYNYERDVTALDAGIRLITLTLETLDPEDRDWVNCVETGARFHELRHETNLTVYDRERVVDHYLLLLNETPDTEARYPDKSRTRAFPEFDDMFEEHAKWQFMLGDSAWKLYMMGGSHEDITQWDAIGHMRMAAERTRKNTPKREARMEAVHEALEHMEVSQGYPGANAAIKEGIQKVTLLDVSSPDRAQALEELSRAYDARFKVREFGDDLKNALRYAHEAYQATHPDHHHELAAILRYESGLQHLLWEESGKDEYMEDAIHYGKRAVRHLTKDETGDEVFRHEVLSYLAHILARKYQVSFAAEPESMSVEGLTLWLDRLPLNIDEDGESPDSTGPYESDNEQWPTFEPDVEESESDSDISTKSSKK
jgi:tetratricopeptide (TPR) repeat protein